MVYRICKVLDRTIAAQVIAPLVCCILSAFDRTDVPLRFGVLRDSLNDVEVARDEYIHELVRFLMRIPRMLTVESKLLRDVADSLKADVSEAARIYLLAYLMPKKDAYTAYQPTGGNLGVFMQVCAGISKQRELTKERIDLILQALLRLELDDRCHVICRTIDAPFYFDQGNETSIVALAHYHPPFVQEYKRVVGPFVKSLDRAHEMVHLDFNLFATALGRLPPKSEITARMEKEMFGDEGHPHGGRIAWAFCSVWAVECLDTFRTVWNLTPETLRRLWTLSKEGKTITLLEATRPFGSSGTRLKE